MANVRVSSIALSQARSIYLAGGLIVLFRTFVSDRGADVTILDTTFAGLDARMVVTVAAAVMVYLLFARYFQFRLDQLDADAAAASTPQTDQTAMALLKRSLKEWTYLTAFSLWAPIAFGLASLLVAISYLLPAGSLGLP